jgi:hypothetical protein
MIKLNTKIKSLLFLFLVLVFIDSSFALLEKAVTSTTQEKSTNKPYHGTEAKSTDLYGISSKGTLYSIKADNVTQINKDQYSLNTIYSKYYLDTNKSEYINLLSKDGMFDSTSNLLELYSDVEINFSEGHRVLTNKLYIDFNKMTMFTTEKVEINSIKGKIFAEHGFVNHMNEKNIYFNGPVTTILVNH